MKTVISAVLLFFLLFSSSCKSDNPYNIPYVVVYFQVFPNGLDSDLGVSRYKYFPQRGYRGVVVYRMGSDQFLAYDRACTFDSDNTKAIVAVNATGVIAVCPVCGSEFSLIDGYPNKGPAKNPLLQYHTSYDGQNVLVTN